MSLPRHNTRVLFWATLFGSVSFLEPVLTLFYLNRGLNESQIIFALTAFSLTVLVTEVPTGAFADRYGPRASMLVGCAIQVLSTIVMMVAHTYWLVWLSRSLAGVSATFFSGAEEALLYESLKEDGQERQMSAVMGRIGSAEFIAAVVTQLAGALLVKDLTEPQFLLVLGISVFFTLLQTAMMFRIRNPRSFEKFRENPLSHVQNGLRVIRRQPNLILLFLNFTVVFIPTYVFTTFDQPYLMENGLPVGWLGALYAGAAAVQFVLSNYAGWFTERFSPVPLMHVTAAIILGSLVLAASLSHSLPVALFAFFFVRLPRALRWPIYSQLQNEYIPSGSRATTLSLLSVFDSVFDLLIVIPIAFTVAPMGRTAIFAGCAAVVFLGMLIPVRRAREAAE